MLERNVMFICMLVYCVVILIIYILKSDKNISSYKKFLWVLIFAVWCILYNIIALNLYQSVRNDSEIIPVLLSRFYICDYVFLFGFLECYIMESVFKEKITFNFKDKWNIYSTLLFIIMLFGIVASFLFPNHFEKGDGYFFSFWGMASNTVYTICFVFQIFNIVYYFVVRKKRNVRFKYIFPTMSIPLLFLTAIFLNKFWSYSFFEMAITIMISIMYFYYEKPDEQIQGILEKSIIDYEKSARFKTDFLSNVSHEIKTPLNSILFTLNYCKDRDNIPGFIGKDIDDMLYCSNTLHETISNILIMSKIDNEKHVFNKSSYNLKTEIGYLPSIIKIKSRGDDVNFFIEIDDNVPNLIYGERELIVLIINNALSYSNRFVKKGTISLKIDWSDENGENLIIQINNVCPDCGNLYSDINSKVVDIYDSVNNAEFGINLSCLLAEKLNGRIDFDYENNLHNSIFYTIPQERNKVQYDVDSIKYNNLKVLVVDDNELNLKVAFKELSSLDVEVDVCDSGKEAIEYAERKEYEIIFLDINMPNMNGEETLNHLLTLPNFKASVVALTADDGVNSREKYLGLGFSDYIVKPFKKNDLIDRIEKINKGGNENAN